METTIVENQTEKMEHEMQTESIQGLYEGYLGVFSGEWKRKWTVLFRVRL